MRKTTTAGRIVPPMRKLNPVPPPESDYVDDVFGAEGMLSRRLVGYAPRASQIRLTRAIDRACREGGVLIAEAPTGTGKTAASLIPAIRHVIDRGGKVVYVTANISLQEQLIFKDLPMIKEATGWNFDFEIAKGFAQYSCLDRLNDLEQGSGNVESLAQRKLQLFRAGPREREDLAQLEKIVAKEWGRGDLSELDFEPSPAVRQQVTVSSEDCLRKKCGFYDKCHARLARIRARSAKVVVANYHLYAIDLAMRARGALGGVLPEHTIAVFDEVDRAADIFREHFGQDMSLGSVRALAADLADSERARKFGVPALDQLLANRLVSEASRFFDDLLEMRGDKDRYRIRFTRPGQVDGRELQDLLEKAAGVYAQASLSGSYEDVARNFLRSRAEGCRARASLLQHCRDLDRSDYACFISGDEKRAVLESQPVSAASFLREHLFGQLCESEEVGEQGDPDEERPPLRSAPRTVVLMSATLATEQGDAAFDYACGRLGVDSASEIMVESPFDFRRTAFIVPRSMPEPSAREFAQAVGAALVEVVASARGRTLGLFTSKRVMEEAHERLVGAKLGYQVLKQDDAPRSELVRRFREDESSVLLGLDSFWSGTDVPGEACVAVVMDKIPFQGFEDPILDLIKARDPDWFESSYVPEALLKFKQGFGRLVRRVGDYGVVVCLDRRITSKGYGRKFQRAVPRAARMSERLSDVEGLLEELRGMGSV